MVVAPGERVWRSLARRARRVRPAEVARRWLILAPHPDDETLASGGLIAALAAAGAPPDVAFLTDGAGSHVGAPGWNAGRVAALRDGEARQALRMLGVIAPPLRLGWRDAAPLAPSDPGFGRACDRLVAVCRHRRIGAIVTTWGGDPHCDHQAAARLAAAVARRQRIRLFETPVWGWPSIGSARLIAVDTGRHRAAQRRALDCHRSQRGGRIAGGESFRLPKAMLRIVDRPLTLLLEPAHAP